MTKFDKIFYTIVIFFSIYLSVGFKLIPYIAQEQLVKNLNNSLTLETHIKKVDFNPFTFNMKIHDFKLGNYEAPTISFEELAVDVGGFKSLFNLYIDIENIILKKAFIDITQYEDESFNIAKLLITKNDDNNKKSNDNKSSSDIKFLVSKLSLQNSSIKFTQETQKEPFSIAFDNINYKLYDLGTFKNPLTSNNFSMDINKNAKLLFKGALKLQPFSMYGKVNLHNLELEKLLAYKKDMLNFTLDKDAIFDTNINFNIDTSKEFELKLHTDKFLLSNININSNKKDILNLKEFNINKIDFNLNKQEVKLLDVSLKNSIINLVQNKDGLNVSNLINSPKKEDNKESKKTQGDSWNFILKNLNFQDASLSFEDSVNDLTIKNPNFSFSTQTINSDGSQIKLQNLSLSNPKPSFSDIKNKTNINADDLTVNLNNLEIINSKITIDNIDSKINSININQITKEQKIDIKNIGLNIEDIYLNKDDINIKKVLLSKPSLRFENKKTDSLIQAKNIYILANKITKNSKLLKIDQVKLNEPALSIYNTKDKTKINTSNINMIINSIKRYDNGLLKVGNTKINNPKIDISLSKKTQNNNKQKTAKKEKATKKEKDAMLDIGPVNINNAQVKFEDKNLPIPFETTISDLNGEISKLDTTKASKTKLKVNGVVDKYGTAKITGIVNPQDIKILTDVNMIFKNISMKSFTPYTSKYIGRELDSGKLDLNLKYNIEKSNLDATNSIIIKKIELGENVKSDDAVSLPLGIAIALLENRNGVIDLDIPISGNVDDPKFQIGSIVWKAFTNLIMKAVTAPFFHY